MDANRGHFNQNTNTVDISATRILIPALDHTLTPCCCVCRWFFVIVPARVHAFQILSDDVHPGFFGRLSCALS